MSDMLNQSTSEFTLMLQQIDKRVTNSLGFIKNINAYISSVPEIVDVDVHFDKIRIEVAKLEDTNKVMIKTKLEATEALLEQVKTSSILNSFLENTSRIGLELMQLELNKTCKLYNFVLN